MISAQDDDRIIGLSGLIKLVEQTSHHLVGEVRRGVEPTS
jgi:hypothetical protein